MNKLGAILCVLGALALGRCSAQCPPPEELGPCECHVDGNGLPALLCRSVASWDDVAAVINGDLPALGSVDIIQSPLLTEVPDLALTASVGAVRFYATGLTHLSAASFGESTAAGLKSLYIKHNEAFFTLDNDLVAQMPALEALYVSHNSIASLDGAMQENVLPYIDLSHNGIQLISSNYFASCKALKVLLLSFNQLTSSDLGPDTLTVNGDPADLYVDLAWNSLSEGVDPLAFGGQPPKELILSHNEITTLESGVFGQLLTAMEAQYGSEAYILLNSNPLACGCDMAWVVDHPGKGLLQQAECDDGRLVSGLTNVDFTGC